MPLSNQTSLFPAKKTLVDKPKSTFSQSAKIVFSLCDQLANKDWPKTLDYYNSFTKNRGDHYYLLAMINRLFRLLVLAKENALKDEKAFTQEKALKQSQNWSILQIKKAYQKLVEFEEAVKTGEEDLESGFLLFLRSLCQIS